MRCRISVTLVGYVNHSGSVNRAVLNAAESHQMPGLRTIEHSEQRYGT